MKKIRKNIAKLFVAAAVVGASGGFVNKHYTEAKDPMVQRACDDMAQGKPVVEANTSRTGRGGATAYGVETPSKITCFIKRNFT